MTRTIFLTFTCALASLTCLCQEESLRKFELGLLGRAGAAYGMNTFQSDFADALSPGLGAHATLDYQGSKWGVSTGIGIESLTFRNRADYFALPELEGYFQFGINYFTLQVPVMLTYQLGEKWRLAAGVNVMWANANQYKASWNYTGAPLEYLVFFKSTNDPPAMQVVSEWMLNSTFQLNERVAFGAYVAGSMQSLEGFKPDLEVSINDELVGINILQFNYDWLRFGLSLRYKIWSANFKSK